MLSEIHASSIVIYLDFTDSTSKIEQEVEVAVEALEGRPVRLTVLRQLKEVEVTVRIRCRYTFAIASLTPTFISSDLLLCPSLFLLDSFFSINPSFFWSLIRHES